MNEALSSPEWGYWQMAMSAELTATKNLKVFHLTKLPAGENVVKHKWVFVKKMNPDGSLNKYRARLVACGYSQDHGLNYFETFSPTCAMENIRLLLALASHYDWKMYQIDVKTAFLHAPLAESVYMQVPHGYSEEGSEGDRVKLDKALYGLKQASREWNRTLVRFLKDLGFVQLTSDTSVFIRGTCPTNFVIVVLHVDDQNVFSTSMKLIVDFKSAIQAQFGIEIEYRGL